MNVAVIGSRRRQIADLAPYLPSGVTRIISGGAAGIDACAREYALAHQIPLLEIRPEYARYRRGAPLKRNEAIVDAADLVLAFWDGQSRGTKYTIDYARKTGRAVRVILLRTPGSPRSERNEKSTR